MNRNIILTGSVRIVDDEWGTDEIVNQSFSGQAVVGENQPSQLLEFSKCCGGEVRAELELTASARLNGDVKITGKARLFEGISCDTDDLEDSKDFDFLVPANNLVEQHFALKNQEWFAHDQAKFKLTLANFPT